MTPEDREKLEAKITAKLIQALDEDDPKAAMLKTAIEWLSWIDRGLVKPAEKEKAKQAALRERVYRFPFPSTPASDQPRREPPSRSLP